MEGHEGCHAHEHGKIEQRVRLDTVTVREHQGTIAGSFSIKTAGPPEVLEEALAKQLKGLARWVAEKEGIIGHIKAGMEIPECVEFFSITDQTLYKKREMKQETVIHIAAIVFLVEPGELKEKLMECMQNLQEACRTMM